MSWLGLSRAELLRLVRFAVRLGRGNPMILLLLIAGAAAFVWLAARAGQSAAALAAFEPVLPMLLAFLSASGALLGFVTASASPRFEDLDPQVATVPISPVAGFLGVTAIPLLVVWTISAVPLLAFIWALIDELGVSGAGLWGLAFAATYILAAACGAATTEAVRARPAGPSRTLAVAGVCATLAAGSVVAGWSGAPWWAWFGGSLLRAATVEMPAPWLVGLAIAVSWTLGAWSWIVLGALPNRRARTAGVVRSRSMGRGLLQGLARSLALRTVRDRRVLGLVFVALGFGLVAPVAAGLALGQQAQVLIPVVCVIVAMNAAALPLALSADLPSGMWLWRTIPTTRVHLGFAWWLIASLVSFGLTAIALAPTAALYPGQREFALLLAVMLAPIPAAVGRILPWRHDSAALQLLTGALLLVAYVFAANEVFWIGERVSEVAGGGVPARSLAFAVAFASVAAPSALICLYAPWRGT